MALSTDLLDCALTVEMPLATQWVYQKYCDYFLIPLEVLLQGEVAELAQAMVHTPFTDLEAMEKAETPEIMGSVTLCFTSETYAVLDRIAHLLRRPLPELARGLLNIGAQLVIYNWEEAENGDGIAKCSDLPSQSHAAVRFNIMERMGCPRAEVGNYSNTLHEHFNIDKPSLPVTPNAEVVK